MQNGIIRLQLLMYCLIEMKESCLVRNSMAKGLIINCKLSAYPMKK